MPIAHRMAPGDAESIATCFGVLEGCCQGNFMFSCHFALAGIVAGKGKIPAFCPGKSKTNCAGNSERNLMIAGERDSV